MLLAAGSGSVGLMMVLHMKKGQSKVIAHADEIGTKKHNFNVTQQIGTNCKQDIFFLMAKLLRQ